MDSALATQLERRRFFRKSIGVGSEEGYFANHCPHCGAMEDYLLHAQFINPSHRFRFSRVRALAGHIEASRH